MPSWRLDHIHGQTKLGITCHHQPWTANTDGRCQTWHAIMVLGMTHGQTTSGVACHHLPLKYIQFDDIERGMQSLPFDSTHDQTTSGVACHYKPWIADTVKRCLEWHVCIALSQHTQSNDVARGMPSFPFYHTQKQKILGVACHYPSYTKQRNG